MRHLLFIVVLVGCSSSKKSGPEKQEAAPAAEVVQKQALEIPIVPQAFWSTCSGEVESRMVTLECGDVAINFTSVQAENAEFELLRKELLRVAVKALEDDETSISGEKAQTLPLPMSNAVDFTLTFDSGDAPEAGYGLIATISKSATLLQTVMCLDLRLAPDPERCNRVASHILYRGIPEDVVKVDPVNVLDFAGRKLTIPEGCTSGGGEDINCLTSHFAWEQVASDAGPNTAENFVEEMLGSIQRLLPNKRPTITELPCQVDEVATRCQRRTWNKLGNVAMVMISGSVRVRSQDLTFACTWRVDAKNPSDSLPPPCNTLLALD